MDYSYYMDAAIGAAAKQRGNKMEFKCTRCEGKGRLPAFGNVLGGVCFKCHGSGKQASKPSKPSIKWAVLGEDRNTGMRARLYNVKSPSAQGAVTKARNMFVNASTAFKDQYSMAAAIAVPATEMDYPN